MRGLIIALVLGAGLHGQAPAQSGALTHFDRQLDTLAKQAEAARNGTDFPSTQDSRKFFFLPPPQGSKFFPDPKPFPAPMAAPPRKRISLLDGQPCAIPLRNVLRGKDADGKMILPPGPPIDGKIRIGSVPARSCHDKLYFFAAPSVP